MWWVVSESNRILRIKSPVHRHLCLQPMVPFVILRIRNFKQNLLVVPLGIAPRWSVFQTDALTTLAREPN